MRPTKVFTADQYARGLASWDWLGVSRLTPVFTSLFGDVFLEAPDGWWFLDAVEGTLRRYWSDPEMLDASLATAAGRDRYLLGEMVDAAARRGLLLAPDEVFVFVPPPIVRGRFDPERIQPLDFVVALNIAGQIHRQIREVPVG